MMNTVKPRSLSLAVVATAFGTALALGGCGGGGGDSNDPVPANDPNALMRAIQDKVASGAAVVQVVQGNPPPASGADAPKATAGIPSSAAVPGDMVALPLRIDGAPDLSNLFAKITGATNQFFSVQINAGSGSKTAWKPTVQMSKNEFSFVALTTLDFRVELPDNLDLSRGGDICFDLSVRESDGSVSEVAKPCVAIGAQRPAVTNDQPPGAEMPARLNGTWVSSCLDIDDFVAGSTTIRGARLGLTFSDAGQTFTESALVYTADDCSAGESSTPQVSGTYVIGASSEDSVQNSLRTRPFDFRFDGQTGLFPCFNRLRIADENGDGDFERLFLGVPRTAHRDQANALPDDCRAEDTRPAYVLTSLPFSKR
jgi:hypothetical protein